MSVSRGYTLIEIIVVLAILVCVVSLTYPLISKRLEKTIIKYEAQNIIQKLNKTKLKAMQSGEQQSYYHNNEYVTYFADGSVKRSFIHFKWLVIEVNPLTGVAKLKN